MAETVQARLEQIHRAAARLFRERGFHGTSVRDIGEQVGIQGGSLYSHMDSKEDLLWEIADHAADRFFAVMRPIATSDRSYASKFRETIAAHVGVITDDLDAAAVFTTEWRHLSDARRAEFARRRDEYEAMFRSLVRDGIRGGVLSPVDEAYATLFILSTLNYVYMWFRPDGRMTSDEVAGMLADFIFDGLRRRTT